MGYFTQSVSSSIEIAASPEVVRSVFLDFGRYSEWHKVFQIKPMEADKKPSALTPGDALEVNKNGFIFHPVLVANDAESFQWDGSIPGLFSGTHHFYFNPSKVTPGGTTLVQGENFRGLLAFLMSPTWSFSKNTLAEFETLNVDLKAEVEKTSRK
ncbi:hypothetical protein BX600DRAFT_438760 [Xylariales sp. PMI_506]|nr:hypothetical protein BX600DRAFT_438760 [Xylariales sp. PMI_506]